MRFDDALSAMVAQVGGRFPEGAPTGTTIVRDAVGLLTLVLPDEVLPSEAWAPLAAALDAALERFSPGNRRVRLRRTEKSGSFPTARSSATERWSSSGAPSISTRSC